MKQFRARHSYERVTFSALDSTFRMSDGKLNLEYLKDNIDIVINNVKTIYDKLYSPCQTHSIIWAAFMYIADDKIKEETAPYDEYYCNSEHLKKWLNNYGYDYKEVFIDLIEKYSAERKELIAQRRKEARKVSSKKYRESQKLKKAGNSDVNDEY